MFCEWLGVGPQRVVFCEWLGVGPQRVVFYEWLILGPQRVVFYEWLAALIDSVSAVCSSPTSRVLPLIWPRAQRVVFCEWLGVANGWGLRMVVGCEWLWVANGWGLRMVGGWTPTSRVLRLVWPRTTTSRGWLPNRPSYVGSWLCLIRPCPVLSRRPRLSGGRQCG